MTGAALARAAEALVGAPFRLHGRDAATGLDCLGVVTAALAASGRDPGSLPAYGLRNRSIDRWIALAERAGFRPSAAPALAGDVVMVRPGPGQHHLLVALEGNLFVHAHAGLRRVVVQPGPLPWSIDRRWRLQQ